MRVPSTALAALAIVATHVSAFKDTAPLIVSSSTPNVALSDAATEITSGVIAAEEIYGTLESLGCDWDALVVVHVDDLHHSQVAKLDLPPPHKASLHIPYLIRPSSGRLRSSIQSWATACSAETSTSLDSASSGSAKQAFWLTEMPSSLAGVGDKQLLIVSGSPSAFTEEERTQEVMRDELRKRQFDGFTEEVVEEVVEDLFDAEVTDPFDEEATDESEYAAEVADVEILKNNRPSPNDTIPSPDAPLLERVQLLSTPVIMSLLITFGVLIPILMFGVSALAGIQVPPRMMEISKAMQVGQQKKDQ